MIDLLIDIRNLETPPIFKGSIGLTLETTDQLDICRLCLKIRQTGWSGCKQNATDLKYLSVLTLLAWQQEEHLACKLLCCYTTPKLSILVASRSRAQ